MAYPCIKAPHMFLAAGGDMFDTRDPQWTQKPPVRAAFAVHKREINTAAAIKSSLRAGAFAWPGGYPIAYLTGDGDFLCPDCVRFHLRDVLAAMNDKHDTGWRVVACDTLEDPELDEFCDHCHNMIGGN